MYSDAVMHYNSSLSWIANILCTLHLDINNNTQSQVEVEYYSVQVKIEFVIEINASRLSLLHSQLPALQHVHAMGNRAFRCPCNLKSETGCQRSCDNMHTTCAHAWQLH